MRWRTAIRCKSVSGTKRMSANVLRVICERCNFDANELSMARWPYCRPKVCLQTTQNVTRLSHAPIYEAVLRWRTLWSDSFFLFACLALAAILVFQSNLSAPGHQAQTIIRLAQEDNAQVPDPATESEPAAGTTQVPLTKIRNRALGWIG